MMIIAVFVALPPRASQGNRELPAIGVNIIAIALRVIVPRGEPSVTVADVDVRRPNMAMTPFMLVGNSADSRGLAECRDTVYCIA